MRGLLAILAVVTLIVSVVVLAIARPTLKDQVRGDQAAETAVADVPPEPRVVVLEPPRVTDAICVLQPTAGHTVSGRVIFHEHDDVVTISATIHGLEPLSTHAFHIHQFGDVSSADGTSAGSHYNPTDQLHGLPGAAQRHAGDLGNVVADDNGTARMIVSFDNISLNGHRNAILGRAMILHAKVDDGGQPTGNAGPRLAMGIIGVAKPPPPETTEAPEVIEPVPAESLEEPEATDENRTAPPAPRN